MSSKSYNVLVVDNEQKICDIVKIFLGPCPEINHIVTATNSSFAIQKLDNQEFHLLITDQQMSGRTGLELIEYCNKTIKFRNVKTLLISGCLKREEVIQAMKIGCKHVLVKPFTRGQLVKKVMEVLNLEESNTLV